MFRAWSLFVGVSIFVWLVLILKPEPARVDIDWTAGERYTSVYDNPSDRHAYREWWIIYKLTNLDRRAVTQLRFVCAGHSKTQFEQRDLPSGVRASGKLRVLGGDIHFDPDTCKPEYQMTSEKVL